MAENSVCPSSTRIVAKVELNVIHAINLETTALPYSDEQACTN